MYPIGVLFGLGFDTATEVGLLALAGATAAQLPWFAILSLPILFAGGMTMMDTADGAFMNVAYGWAFSKPVRRVFYNLTITALSVAVALIIGTIEVISICITYFNLSGGVWHFFSAINLNTAGFIIVGMFIVTWLAAVAVWRFGHIEQRWALAPSGSSGMASVSLSVRPTEHESERDVSDPTWR
jgi:high-affinity nickel-transport protein